jgi:intracellular sulfur oxidation DsrE/DsrF family protein
MNVFQMLNGGSKGLLRKIPVICFICALHVIIGFLFQITTMKHCFTLLLFLVAIVSVARAQEKHAPMVPGFGAVYEIPDADLQPDASLEYKLVMDVTGGLADPSELNPSLFRIARTLNLHVLGGVARENIKAVAVIHSKATPSVLSSRAYRKHFDADNPNTELISALANAGVEIYICGQSLIARGYAEDKLHPDIKKSISAITILTEYQLKGYALMPF